MNASCQWLRSNLDVRRSPRATAQIQTVTVAASRFHQQPVRWCERLLRQQSRARSLETL